MRTDTDSWTSLSEAGREKCRERNIESEMGREDDRDRNRESEAGIEDYRDRNEESKASIEAYRDRNEESTDFKNRISVQEDKFIEHNLRRPNVICVDPPRKGCDKACLDTMLKMQPERIVYVSCDSATLARDVKYLTESGYELKRVRGCDMFPNSVHVESVVLITRKEK